MEDPFQDPIMLAGAPTPAAETTLAVGRDASLTLGTDSLIVLDEGFTRFRGQKCCGVTLPHKSIQTRSIPFFNILWAQVHDLEIVVHHAAPASSPHVRVAVISYAVDKTALHAATLFCSRLLDRAYGESLRRKRVRVLVNPFGGTGGGLKIYSRDIGPIFEAAGCRVEVTRTDYRGHATEIAEGLDVDAWDVVACVSGDGLPHEVFNGLGKKRDAARALREIAVVQLPAGSGNAMSLNLNGTDSPSLAALCVVKGLRMPLDLVSITQDDRRMLSFLSQSFGIVADTDLGTENLRWMGDLRFTYGVLTRLLGKTVYPCELAVKVVDDDKTSIRENYRNYLASARTPTQTKSPLVAPLTDIDGDSTTSGDQGLPPLRFGTVQDPLPAGWEMRAYPTMGNFYSGNMAFMARDMNFFQAALPSDGCLDLINIDGNVGRLSALRIVAAVGNNSLFHTPSVSYRKVEAYRLIPLPRRDKRGRPVGASSGGGGYVSVDGESLPYEPFQVEVHRGLGTVLARGGRAYEVPRLE